MKITLKEVQAHVPGIVTEDMLRFARDEVFTDLHYIFITCVGKNKTRKRMAHCSHCGHDFSGENLKHASRTYCPNCNFQSTVYYSWFSTRPCVRYGYMIYWQKSAIDANTVTAIEVDLKLDMSGEIAQIGVPMIEANMREMFVFCPGKGSIRYSKYYWSNWGRTEAISNPLRNVKYPARMAGDTFVQAISGTEFERMGVLNFDACYSIECLDMASRWPSFEYINKLGFSNLLLDKMHGKQTFGAINWNGKSLLSVLGLTKEDLKEIKANKTRMEYMTLYILRKMRRNGEQVTVGEADRISSKLEIFGKQELDEMFRFGNFIRVCDYYRKQETHKNETGWARYYTMNSVHQDYKDYRAQCIQLGLDLADTAIRWPANLHQAHQNLTAQIQYKQNAELDEKVKLRANELNNYNFDWDCIIMHPFTSSKEIIDEGKTLNHCVGGYVRKYATGATILCAVRRTDAPETPWYTVEFTNDGTLVQCRGLRNQTKEEDKLLLEAFWAAYKAHKTKKARKTA